MKKDFFKYIIILAAMPMMLSSCSDDFLNEIDPNNQTTVTFWNSEENVMKGLSAIYNPFRHMSYGYYGGYEGILHLQMRADDLYPTRGEEPGLWEYLSFVNTPNSADKCWSNIYQGIQLANEFLYNAPKVNMDKDKLEQMLGEAYFIRGFWYFRLRTDYRDAVIRTLPQDADQNTYGLSSGDKVLEQAISDFREAKNRLPILRPTDENGRVTRGAAIAMLGKALVWKGDFKSAKEELEIIMGGDYNYDLTDKFEDNFRSDTEFNEESIWEINYDDKGNPGDSWGDSTGDNAFMGNNLAHYFGPTLKDGLSGGWYKMQPSPYLIKQFVAEPRESGSDTKWDKRLYTTCFFKYTDYGDAQDELFYGNKIKFDDMFKWTALPEGDDKYRINSGYGPAYPEINGKEGRFLMKKFAAWWCPTGCTMYSNSPARINNFRIMRFAEVLLLHAEACLETNDEPGAMNDIKRIRQRAGLPDKTFTGKDAIMEELRKQKLLEFAGENVRWDDLVRWYGKDPAQFKSIMQERKTDSMKYNVTKDSEGKVVYAPTGIIEDTQGYNRFEEKFMYFPIPQAEVDANLDLEQKAEWK